MRPRQVVVELLEVVVRSSGCSGIGVRMSRVNVMLIAVLHGM